MYFWAKTTKEGQPGISVLEHMLNVGFVAQELIKNNFAFLNQNEFTLEQIGALTALHDLGKISPGFQQKCEEWIIQNNLDTISKNCGWDAYETNHGKISHSTIQSFLSNIENVSKKISSFISAALGAHHGKICARADARGIGTIKINEVNNKVKSSIDWDQERNICAKEILKTFSANLTSLSKIENLNFLWWLAGLTTIADWIGSDEKFFSASETIDNEKRLKLAKDAISEIGFNSFNIVPNLSFAELFGFKEGTKPNDMQKKTASLINKPGIYIIEAPMGMGKTEAALWAAYNLMQDGKASGIYFALPTQATSNRIHLRMSRFINKISYGPTSSKLIHSNSWLLDSSFRQGHMFDGKKLEKDDSSFDWFASSKRALLAPFGVGTIDQALLGVLSVKHFFIRHFALAGKVVIIDEVHSYDLYTGTLIDQLISLLETLGCTVIILSATLTKKRRGQFIELSNLEEKEIDSYPLISGVANDKETFFEEAESPLDKEVDVIFRTKDNSVQEAIQLAKDGGMILWITNTVKSAQQQYDSFKELSGGDFPIGLLHSRFPFWRRENIEEEWMERFGKENLNRTGAILVSTQIVEQSVDLDADLLITELAPTDMMLQRMGRLWRHDRKNRPNKRPCVFILEEEKNLEELKQLEASEIKKTLGGKSFVYSPYVLLRSLEEWKKHNTVLIPSQIRNLIEETYIDKTSEPTSWIELKKQMMEKSLKNKELANRNSNLWLPASDDSEGVQTRFSEAKTLNLILCNSISDKEYVFVGGEKINIEKDLFNYSFAKAIHNNMVKVPFYYLKENIEFKNRFKRYLYGHHILGTIQQDGTIKINELKPETKLSWSIEKGVEKL